MPDASTPRSHEDLRMAGHGSVWIAVAPAVAYAAVSDLPRMGEWSPENRGGTWDHAGSAPAVGATFHGHNRAASGDFDTIATVIEADAPRAFAFRVATPGAAGTTWRYEFRTAGAGTTVTESFDWFWTAVPPEGFRGRVGRMPIEQAVAAVRERRAHLQDQIERTLAALKRALERDSR